MMFDLDNLPSSALKLLLAIEDSGSMTEAARQCGVSQPAASKAIARMEQLSGLALIRRDRRPVCLTAEGRILADYARHQAAMARTMGQKLTECRSQGSGIVRIASFGASASTHILPQLIGKARRARPLMQVEISEGTDQQSLQAVRDGMADFAIAIDNDLPDLDMIHLAKDQLVALVNMQDPLARTKCIDAKTLASRNFILTKGGSEPLVRAWFAQSGFEPNVSHNIQQITSILAMVRAGMGVSVIAEMAVPSSHDGIAILPLTPKMPRSINLVRKEGSFSSHAAELFWTMVQSH